MSKLVRVFVLSLMLMSGFSTCDAAVIREGDQGSEVAELQGRLASLGYDVNADGDFGPATVEAVKSFQAELGLEADGLVGASTYEALMGREMPTVVTSRGANNHISRRLVQSSMQYIGVPYVFGGTSPGGFDCSGYVQFVFAGVGISLPRTADAQYEVGTPVGLDELRPGDLVFFSTYTYGPSHVGIYLGGGNFINSSSSRGVSVAALSDSYWGACYIGARRVM